MKKIYLLISFVLTANICFSQKNKPSSLIYNEPKDLRYNVNINEINPHEAISKKKRKFNQKAFLDTLAYEDFDGGLNGWVVTDVNNNGNIWEWDTTYKQGMQTGSFKAINSTTGSDGFLSLPADFYNSPAGLPSEMNTYITSPAISLKRSAGSIYLELQQYMAICCFARTTQFLEISADSIKWDTIPGIDESTPVGSTNQLNTDIQPTRFNISSVAANEDIIYIRLRANGFTKWFWMVDDITILEGPKHDLELREPRLLFHTDSFDITPSYSMVPFDLFTPASISATIANEGWGTAKNTSLLVDINRIRDLNGNVVNNNIYTKNDTVPGNDLDPYPNRALLNGYDKFSPLLDGVFQIDFVISTDSVDQNPGSEEDSVFMVVSDSAFARDDGDFNPSIGISPVSIVQGTSVGGYDSDACATMYILESKTKDKVIPTSITFYVTSNPANIGIEIAPSIWLFNEDTNFAVNAWLPEDFNNTTGKGLVLDGPKYKIAAADTNGFLTLPLDTFNFAGLDSGQYMVGWEVMDGSTLNRDVYFEVANDLSTAARQPSLTSALYHANTTPKRIIYNSEIIPFQPVIRLNVNEDYFTSVKDSNPSKNQIFDLVPNPTNGELKINLMVEGQAIYNLYVRNVIGQAVYTDIITVKGGVTEKLDLSHLDRGIYFVSLENAVERLQKKVILQ